MHLAGKVNGGKQLLWPPLRAEINPDATTPYPIEPRAEFLSTDAASACAGACLSHSNARGVYRSDFSYDGILSVWPTAMVRALRI